MAHLDSLISKITDPQLREQIEAELAQANKTKKFGLVFERHLPESVETPGVRPRRGDQVRFKGADKTAHRVLSTSGDEATVASLAVEDGDSVTVPISDLIVIRDFNEPVYTGMKQLGGIHRGGDKPVHAVIRGENYHALEAMLYTDEGTIDVIYIDPPYNTGNDDWIYNDRYVDPYDGYRHSMWLSFMARRLELARRLLKPSGVIFISIDDNEHARLKLLCDQIFGGQNKITSFLWEKTAHFGRQKQNFYSNVEYIVAYAKSGSGASGTLAELLVESVKTEFEDAPLFNRSNPTSELAFPAGTVRFNIQDGTVSESSDEKYVLLEPVVIQNGLNSTELRLKFQSRWSQKNTESEIAKGTTFLVKTSAFAIRAVYADGKKSLESPRQSIFTNRNNPSRTISRFGQKVGTNDEGSALLGGILGKLPEFAYPKPVSLIEYLLSLVGRKNSRGEFEHTDDMVVLDFFGGTGTTTEAVMRLNAQDGGRRRSILVTNNELAAATSKKLAKAGVQPGDAEWESEGVFEKVTRPRIEAVVSGIRRDGSKYSDGLDENVEFFELTYEDEKLIQLGRKFKAVAPLLWMKAGARGRIIDEINEEAGYALVDGYGVLFDVDRSRQFLDSLAAIEASGVDTISNVFVVSPSTASVQAVASSLPAHVHVWRLYDNYLSSFRINTVTTSSDGASTPVYEPVTESAIAA